MHSATSSLALTRRPYHACVATGGHSALPLVAKEASHIVAEVDTHRDCISRARSVRTGNPACIHQFRSGFTSHPHPQPPIRTCQTRHTVGLLTLPTVHSHAHPSFCSSSFCLGWAASVIEPQTLMQMEHTPNVQCRTGHWTSFARHMSTSTPRPTAESNSDCASSSRWL